MVRIILLTQLKRDIVKDNKNILQRFGHIMGRGEEFMLRVAMNLKMKRKISRGRQRLRWLDNVDSLLKENHISKEFLGKKC